MLGLHVAEVRRRDTTWVARMTVVDLVDRLGAGHTQLSCVDDDDEVTGVDVRRVNGLVFAAQTESNFAGYSSEDLVGRVNHKPLCVTSAGFALNVLVMSFLFEEGLSSPFPRSAFLWRESLRWVLNFAAGLQKRCEAFYSMTN